jgi:hypothetical protein
MSEPVSDRRMAENQVVFRRANENVQKSLDDANVIATEEGEEPIQLDADAPLHFYCECSDENCRQRVKLSLNDYNKIHQARNTFVIVCGHDVPKIEEVTEKHTEYCVVTKHEEPPRSDGQLNATPVENV